MFTNKLRSLGYLILLMSIGCVEPYHPSLSTEEVDIMVVNGSVNTSKQSATVNLSHANAIANPNEPLPEKNATVTISIENGSSFKLEETIPGNYSASSIPINSSARYQLSVVTKSGNEYLSEYVGIEPTPAIDSVSWESNDEGINLFANAHDFTDKTKYYKWSFVETWAYRSVFSSEFDFTNKQLKRRGKGDLIDLCYRTIPSTRIYIGTTERLSQNIISRHLLLSIPKADVKLSERYSLLLTQRALSKEEYVYLQQLQRTTETLGSLFDPQPSPISGNIHNVKDPSKPVIGFFSAGRVIEKRIFIEFKDLPIDLRILPLTGDCNILDTVCVEKPAPTGIYCKQDLEHMDGNPVLVSAVYNDKFQIIAFTKTTQQCGDCRAQGGTLEKPEFW